MTTQTLHFESALLPSGWASDARVTSTNGRILSVETGVPPKTGDQRRTIGIPGMPNLHSHAFQRAMAGLTEARGNNADSFWTWREAMYRFVGRITPDQLSAIAAMAQVEMLESGFTRVGEFHYLHHDVNGAPYADPASMSQAVVEAAKQTGIALTHIPVFYAYSGFCGRAPEEGQRRFVTGLDQFARMFETCRKAASALPDAIVGVAPHSLRAIDGNQLNLLAQLADGAPIHIHIAEQIREVEDCLTHYGARPVEWLIDNAPVGPDWCLVHATHVEDQEISSIAARGAVVGLCPVTEANLGDGIFPASNFLEVGGRIGVGSDSNVLIDMTEELRLLEYGQRLTLRARNVLASEATRSTGRRLFDAALAGGSQALGAASGIAVGLPADIVALDADHPALVGKSNDAILDSLVFAGGRAVISDVWRHGRHVVTGGRHVARDAIEGGYRRTLRAMLA